MRTPGSGLEGPGRQGRKAPPAGTFVLGIALFLVAVPPDRALGGRADLSPVRLLPALLALRIGTGATLLLLGSDDRTAPYVRALGPVRQTAGAAVRVGTAAAPTSSY